jgi:nucleoside-diphosphate-sugar epimerase
MKNCTGVLITGGFGFIGSHLTEYFLSRQIPVICLDNLSTSYLPNKKYLESLPGTLKFVQANVQDPWSKWTENIESSLLAKVSHVFFCLP